MPEDNSGKIDNNSSAKEKSVDNSKNIDNNTAIQSGGGASDFAKHGKELDERGREKDGGLKNKKNNFEKNQEQNIVKFNEWQKLDLRIGKITKVEDVENADKLYKLEISLGKEKRTLVAGLKDFYKKQELENKKVIVFTNLQPKKIRGIKSHGMLLAGVEFDKNNNEKNVSLLQPDSEIELGSKVM